MEPSYMSGDMNKIALACTASAAIPGVVPPVLIDEHLYSDGANFSSSPLTGLQGQLLKYIQSNPDYFHMTYVNCKDLSKPNILPSHNLFDTWKQAVNDLIKSQTLIDRLIAYELLLSKGMPIEKASFPCNYEELLKVKRKRETVKYSLLEIFPLEGYEINITNFKADDITTTLNFLYDKCHCHFWWIN